MKLAHLAVLVALICAPAARPQAQAQEAASRTFPMLQEKFAPRILLEPSPRGVPKRRVYRKGVEEIKLSEGLVPHLYNDAAGYCTIGYGHLLKMSPCDGSEPPNFLDGLTEEEAEALLIGDMAVAQLVVEDALGVEPTDGQYAALVSFTFNVGGGNFRASTLLKRVNAGRHEDVPPQFRRWRLAGGRVLQGLVKRREREIELYFDGMEIPQARGAPLRPVDLVVGERS